MMFLLLRWDFPIVLWEIPHFVYDSTMMIIENFWSKKGEIIKIVKPWVRPPYYHCWYQILAKNFRLTSTKEDNYSRDEEVEDRFHFRICSMMPATKMKAREYFIQLMYSNWASYHGELDVDFCPINRTLHQGGDCSNILVESWQFSFVIKTHFC